MSALRAELLAQKDTINALTGRIRSLEVAHEAADKIIVELKDEVTLVGSFEFRSVPDRRDIQRENIYEKMTNGLATNIRQYVTLNALTQRKQIVLNDRQEAPANKTLICIVIYNIYVYYILKNL